MSILHKNRYGKIHEILMCYPVIYKAKNETINYELAFKQYNEFINFLSAEGIKLYFLTPLYGENQVFTRDVAFVIDNIMFISKMSNKDRLEEYRAIEEYVSNKNIKTYKMQGNIEGGDVIVHDDKIFIGLSTRTTIEGIQELESYLKKEGKDYEIVVLKFEKEKALHLDCVFNIVNKESCIVSNYLLDQEKIKDVFKNYYYIDEETSLKLGTNIICLDDNKVLSSNKSVCKMLESKGIDITYIDFSEFIKGGGSFTCITLPTYGQ